MDKQTVLYLNHSAQMSGAEASLRSLLGGLRQIDAPISPVVALPGEGPFTDLLREEGWNVTLAPLRRLQRPRGLIDGMAAVIHVLQTAPHICRLVEQSGAHIVHSNSTTAQLVGGVAAERTHRPAIWHCRDLVSLARIAPQLAAKSSRVVAISACVAEALERDGVPREKISVVLNGIDPEAWRFKAPNSLRQTLGISDEAIVFGAVGQLVPWKNHAAFIEAAARLCEDEGCANARFVVIGGDLWGEQSGYVDELRALVKKHNLIERFNFVPHQSDAIEALGALDCLVHPALDEPFGRVIMEAMALQKPVIAFNQNGPREIITHEHDGLLANAENDVVDELASAMQRILSDVHLGAELGHNGRLSVKEKFHIADSAARIGEIYAEVSG